MYLSEDKNYKCAVCGKESKHKVIQSTDAIGSADLDFRPPGLARIALSFEIMECPQCGYVSGYINNRAPAFVNLDWLQSESYRTCEGIDFQSDLAKRYYRHYLIMKEDHAPVAAKINALTAAAWASDDSDDKENASQCRIMVANLLNEKKRKHASQKKFLWAEHMRRAGKFDKVLAGTEKIRFHARKSLLVKLLESVLKRTKSSMFANLQLLLEERYETKIALIKLFKFEQKHAKMKDSERYTIAEALREMNENEK